MTLRLIGYADPLGRSEGFQVPLFADPPANELLVQRLSGDRLIASFEPLGGWEGRIDYVPQKPVSVGEPHRWAFAFGPGELIEGAGDEGRETLAGRIDDDFLRKKPLLQMEVAEFLDMPDERTAAARRALDTMSELDADIAATWLDLSVLTPDLRRALGRLAAEPGGPFRRVVARMRKGGIEVAGLDGSTRPDLDHKLRLACGRVLDALPGLYPRPRSGWSIELRQPDPPQPKRPVRAVIYLANERDGHAIRLIDPYQREGMLTYAEHFLEAFASTASDADAPIFVVSRRPGEAADRAISMTHGRAVEIVLDAQLVGGPGPRWRDMPPPKGGRILVARTGNSRVQSSDAATARSIRVAVQTADAWLRTEGRPIRGTHVLARSIGIGPQPDIDAMASLHDRLASVGINDPSGLLIEMADGRPRQSEGLGRQAIKGLLLPGLRPVEASQFSEASRGRLSITALAELDGQHGRAKPLARRAAALLEGRGWEVDARDVRGDGGTLEISGRTGPHTLRIDVDGHDRRDSWDGFEDLASGETRIGPSIDLELSHLASPASILDSLKRRGAWTVDMRDLCASDPERGFWSIAAHQVRRLAGGQTSRARTKLMGLLIEQGLDTEGHAILDGNGVMGILRDTAGRGRLEVVWTRVREESGATTALVRFVVPRQLPRTDFVDDLPSFGIAIHRDGISAFEAGSR